LQTGASAEQSRGSPPVHAPDRQVSSTVQYSPSSHGVPSAAGALVQIPVAGSQVSTVHGLPSSQSSAVAHGVQFASSPSVRPSQSLSSPSSHVGLP
jgi:hypothetical protein